MTRLVVGPFNRVEGDLEVKLEVQDGRVAAAFVTAPLFRGFEQILQDRPPLDALVVAPRICGICSVSQSLAAARALAQVMGLEPPPNGRIFADLMLACENAADHLTHFALFFMPDFARAAYAGRSWHGEAEARFAAHKGASGREAVAARTAFLHLMGILAGKWPHSLALQPGGAAKSLDLGERMRLQAILLAFRRYLEQSVFGTSLEAAAEDLAAWSADSDAGLFLRIADDLGLAGQGRGVDRFLSGGGLFSAALPDLSGLREDIAHAWLRGGSHHPSLGVTLPDADKRDAYSWCKAPRLDGHPHETGALARQWVAGHPLVGRMLAEAGGRADVKSRVVARLIELARLLPRMESLLAELRPNEAYCLAPSDVPDGEGMGLVEAARGLLGHWLRVEKGVIASYQIVAPTSWNFSPRDGKGVPGPVEQALAATPVEQGQGAVPLMVQHVVRSFDPCMSCTVH